nr:retrovirus-related Pol polyprotein from transposon TNT 1-94 [Tanacetum cinerariifolium]
MDQFIQQDPFRSDQDECDWFDHPLPYFDGIGEHLNHIQVKDIVKEVKDYLKTHSSVGMDISRFDNQDKRLKSIIISCLPNDVMKSVIKCKTTKAMWNDLILAHEGPSNTRDTKIVALRLKFNAFKALEGEKLNGRYTRFTIQPSSSKALISNSQMQDINSDVEEDLRSSSKFIADLNAEYHERALFANQKRTLSKGIHLNQNLYSFLSFNNPTLQQTKFHSNSTPQHNHNTDNNQKNCKVKYKGLKAEIDVLTKKIEDMSKGKSEKGLVAETFDWDEELVSIDDEGFTKIKAFMAITEDELYENLLSKFNSLNQGLSLCKSELAGGRGKKNNIISSKEVLFSKGTESPSKTAHEIMADSKFECDIQELLPPHFKLVRAEPNDSSKDEISLVDLTLTLSVSKEIKKVPDKRSTVKILKKAKLVTASVLDLSPNKKADSSTEKLLLTLMEELKGLKEQIKIPSDTSSSVSQSGSTKYAKGKQRTWLGPSVVKKTLAKLKAQSSQGSSVRKALMIPKPFIDCEYCGFSNHYSDECEYYPGWVKQYLHKYSNESGPKVVFRDNSLGETEGYSSVNSNGITFTKVSYVNGLNHNLTSIGQLKMKNINEVRVNELRSDIGTEFRNHKLEELCDEKGISQNFSSFCTLKQNDHLGKFDKKADDGFFLGYSLVAKAFRNSVSLEEPSKLTTVDDHPALNEPDHLESVNDLEPAELQDIVINELIIEVQSSPITITSLVEVNSHPHVPQDR